MEYVIFIQYEHLGSPTPTSTNSESLGARQSFLKLSSVCDVTPELTTTDRLSPHWKLEVPSACLKSKCLASA